MVIDQEVVERKEERLMPAQVHPYGVVCHGSQDIKPDAVDWPGGDQVLELISGTGDQNRGVVVLRIAPDTPGAHQCVRAVIPSHVLRIAAVRKTDNAGLRPDVGMRVVSGMRLGVVDELTEQPAIHRELDLGTFIIEVDEAGGVPHGSASDLLVVVGVE